MDAKDLITEEILSRRYNDTNFNSKIVANNCEKTKSYTETRENTMNKGEVPTTRPCAVIGPDRVVPPAPPAPANSYLKKAPHEPWLYNEINYHRPTEYSTKISEYQNPVRDISPRQTFQENMQRYVMPPRYSVRPGEDSSLVTDPNVMHLKSVRYSPSDGKYCEVPYNVNQLNEPKLKGVDVCSSDSNIIRNQPSNIWPSGPSPVRQTSVPEAFQYPVTDYPSCAGPRPVPVMRPPRTQYDEAGNMYSDPYQDGHRFKPYPSVKERYPPPRYDMRAFTNPYNSPYPAHKYDLSNAFSPQAYPCYPHPPKYIDPIDSYQRSNIQPNYNVPYHSQVIHSPYGLAHGNNLQNKFYPYHASSSVKPIVNKPPFDPKAYHESFRHKNFPISDYYVNDMSSSLPVKGLSSNYSSVNMQGLNPYQQHLPGKNYDYTQPCEVSINISNPLSRQSAPYPSHYLNSFSRDVNTTYTAQRKGILQDNFGYSNNSTIYNGFLRNSKASPNMIHAEVKDKKGLDVRQFLQMWNEGDDDNNEANSSYRDVNVQSSSQGQEQLVVLGLVNVPKEELSKYEHIQKVSKLPDNIKGYNSIELLNQFEEAIESSKLHNFLPKPRDITVNSNRFMLSQVSENLPRPVSPLDVEAKISQSVIHKEVGCNFEIRPCTPKMLNAEIAKPIQTLLNERTIEKISNNVSNSPEVFDLQKSENSDKIKRDPSSVSCKMLQAQCENETNMETIKKSYNIQDFEGNSGVCLASLPRLDNDIELNFPEVNQQFINSNKQDTVKLKDLPILDDQSKCATEIKDEKDVTTEKENEFTKLSKYRRKSKFICDKLNENHTGNFRTNSVIIKNPDNPREAIETFQAQTIFANEERQSVKTSVMFDTYKGAENNFESFDSICFDNNNAAYVQLPHDLMSKKLDEKSTTSNLVVHGQKIQEHDLSNKNSEEHISSCIKKIKSENDAKDKIMITSSVNLNEKIIDDHETSNSKSTKYNDINLFDSNVETIKDEKLHDTNSIFNKSIDSNKNYESKPDVGKHSDTINLISKDCINDGDCMQIISDDLVTCNVEAIEYHLLQSESKKQKDTTELSLNVNGKSEHCVKNTDNKNEVIGTVNLHNIKNNASKNNAENEDCLNKSNKCHNTFNDLDSNEINTEFDKLPSQFQECNLNAKQNTEINVNCEEFLEHNEKCDHIVLAENEKSKLNCSQSQIAQPSVSKNSELYVSGISVDETFSKSYKNTLTNKQTKSQRSKLSKMLFSPWIQKLLLSNDNFREEQKVVKGIDITSKSNNATCNSESKIIGFKNRDIKMEQDIESEKSFVISEDTTKLSKSSIFEYRKEIKNVEENPIDMKGCDLKNNADKTSHTNPCMVSESKVTDLVDNYLGISKSYQRSNKKMLLNDYVCSRSGFYSTIFGFSSSYDKSITNSAKVQMEMEQLSSQNGLIDKFNDIRACNYKSDDNENSLQSETPVPNSCMDEKKDDQLSPCSGENVILTDSKDNDDKKYHVLNFNVVLNDPISNERSAGKQPITGDSVLFMQTPIINSNNIILNTANEKPRIDSNQYQDITSNNETDEMMLSSVSDKNCDNDEIEKTLNEHEQEEEVSMSKVEKEHNLLITTDKQLQLLEYESRIDEENKDTSKIINNIYTENNKESLAISSESFKNKCCLNKTLYENCSKPFRSLKRSLSASLLFDYIKKSKTEMLDHSPAKKNNKEDEGFDTESRCNIIHNRRNSVATHYNEEFSVCILIDDNCIITEEDEEVLPLVDNIVDIVQEDCEVFSQCVPADDIDEQKNDCYNENIIFGSRQSKETMELPTDVNHIFQHSFESPWVDDIACVETVVTDEITEGLVSDTEVTAEFSEDLVSESFISDEFTQDFCSNTLTTPVDNDAVYESEVNNMKNIAILDESETNSSVMPVSLETIECDRLISKQEQQSACFTQTGELGTLESPSIIANIFFTKECSKNKLNLVEEKSNQDYLETQDATVHSCEESIDEVFPCNDIKENYIPKISSSPEVSSTTSEEKRSQRFLSISGSETHKNDSQKDEQHCLFNKDFTKPRRLITKAAKKYIPPLNEPINELKVKLPLSPNSLFRLQQLKTMKQSNNPSTKKCYSSTHYVPHIKKVKPKFEDILKSLDEVNIKTHKDKNKKPKHIPKVVIKKHENGSHYASAGPKSSFNPDLSAKKWQPWVFIEKNKFVEKMALHKKVNAIYNHRKKTFVLTEKFKKYRAMGSAQFVISQPKSVDPTKGQLKYTIKLTHSY